MTLPWPKFGKKNKHKLPWALGYSNPATGEVTIIDSEGHIVARLGASHSGEKQNVPELAVYIIESCNSYGRAE